MTVRVRVSVSPFQPPRNFRPSFGAHSATFVEQPGFITRKPTTGAKANGIRYERKAQQHLQEVFGESYVASPWISFFVRDKHNWCQPDGFIIDVREGRITVVEIKLKHTQDAWWQVRQLYTPVLQSVFNKGFSFSALEVVKWFDPHTRFPERFNLVRDLSALDHTRFNVHIWGGRSEQ